MNVLVERRCWIRDFRNTITKSSRGKGFKTARRAVARKMFIIMWCMLTNEGICRNN